MLAAIRDFFEQRIADRPDDPAAAEQRAQVAAAALLIEVVSCDHHFSGAEREAVVAAVGRKFGLGEPEAHELFALAEAEHRDAHDLFQFTSKINATFSPERKRRLIEELWRAAWADEVLHRHEEYLIRRVTELLHLPHSAFIQAKLKVQAQASD